MASQAGFDVENKFINGLITESTALNFPKDACTDTLNCVFNEFGLVTRRLGLDTESSAAENTITPATGDVYTEFVWYTSASTDNRAFLVQQGGATLYFFDITSSAVASATLYATISLSTYLPSGSGNSPATIGCQYATGNSCLLVTNQVLNPFFCKWDETTSTIVPTVITLKHRDTAGLDDGLAVDFRPTSTVSGLTTSNPSHYYNLLNQGWAMTTALAQWDSGETTLPSNADAIAYYRSSKTDALDTSTIGDTDPGNSPAPKGHFILNVGEDDRTAALSTAGFTAVALGGNAALIYPGIGSTIGNFTNSSNAFNGVVSGSSGGTVASATGTTAYIGKNYSATSGTTVGLCTVYGSSDAGFVSSFSGSMTLELYGKASLPASATDGTLIGTTVVNDSNNISVAIASTDTATVYNYVWVRIRETGGSSATFFIAEVQFYTRSASFNRPRCVSFFAGRAFFAGVDGSTNGSNVYFSQVVVDNTKYGLCYQQNDPTSENFADLLATDGGVIKIPEMGRVQRLFPFQTSLMVFADNGVWLIDGSGNNPFAATSYSVRRISNVGMNSPYSVVDVKGVPCWWAEDGIYTVTYDANYNSTTIKSLTEETIKTVVLSVPAPNRPYIKATFDRLNNYVYWVYNDGTSLTADQLQTFDHVLVFNAKTSAFFPWQFDNTTSNVPVIQGLIYIQDGNRSDSANYGVKYAIKYTRSATVRFTYAQIKDSTNWKDWSAYSTLISSLSNLLDYSSYIVAGYRLDAQAMRNFQSNYVWTFMNNLSNSSVMLQGLWDFTNSSSSGKWSTPQQGYNSLTTKGRTYDDVRVSRRVVRGTGKALQVKYYSVTSKPFALIGWGLFESANDAP